MAGVSAPTCDTPPTMRYWRWRPGGDVRYSHDSSDPDEDSNVAARGHRWQRLLSISIPIAFVQLIACIPLGDAVAQICTVSSSSVTLGSGSCSISPNTTLNGSPAVHATTNAQITTNNVTVNPNNGGSTGGLAETNGTIIFSAGSSINGNWATDAAGDAPFPVIPVRSANHPALDILEASASDDGTNLTFKLKMADLSATALADAATAGGTPTWMVTWWEGKNGLGPNGVTSGPFHSPHPRRGGWRGITRRREPWLRSRGSRGGPARPLERA